MIISGRTATGRIYFTWYRMFSLMGALAEAGQRFQFPVKGLQNSVLGTSAVIGTMAVDRSRGVKRCVEIRQL